MLKVKARSTSTSTDWKKWHRLKKGRKPLEKLKVAELKELLEKSGVEYEADAKKADLVALAQTISKGNKSRWKRPNLQKLNVGWVLIRTDNLENDLLSDLVEDAESYFKGLTGTAEIASKYNFMIENVVYKLYGRKVPRA